MVKASALYMVIIIALVISILCSAVIVAGYYYRAVYQSSFRYDQLRNNLFSGINLLLTDKSGPGDEKKFSLFENGNDSVLLQKKTWGIFDLGIARSFIQHDTLGRSFLMANTIDSAKWAAIYLIDEDRSLSVSGNTHIKGTVFLPKAGIREAYVNNQAYTGDKRIIIGTKKASEKTLPALDVANIQNIEKLSKAILQTDSNLIKNRETTVSFFDPTRTYNFKKRATVLSNIRLHGNIVLYADTTLTIDSTAQLENIIVFAPGIIVKNGFKGNCQLFATDSISVGANCSFKYPSCIAITNFNKAKTLIKIINIGKSTTVAGAIFIYDSYLGKLPPIVSLEKEVTISGQVYVQGLINLKDKVSIYGSAFANRFLYQTAYTRYENYLINLDADASRLSPYYLSSSLFPAAGTRKKILQWLN